MEVMEQMRPGLIQLEIGVQTTNPDTITEIRRKMNLDRLKRVVDKINGFHNIHQLLIHFLHLSEGVRIRR